MLILLSPAKSLDFSPAPEGLGTTPLHVDDTAVLMKRCKSLTVPALCRLMSLSRPLGELNRQRFQEMSLPFTPDNAKPCVLAFAGDVYQKLDAPSLSRRDLDWAQSRLRILSGLYGLLRPLDLIQPYRLEMGTRLKTRRGKSLYEFWGKRLVNALNAEPARHEHAAVLNLASNEYFKAIPVRQLKLPVVTAVFQDIRDGHPKTIGLLAKKARGMMARFVIENRIDEPEKLKDFAAEGYGFRPELSAEDRFVFIRDA